MCEILVVEDVESISVFVKGFLESQSNGKKWTCYVVDNLKDALSVQHNFDTVILDLRLPDSERENTIEHIRDFDGAVVIYSASDDRETIRRCMEAGAKSFIMKGSPGKDIHQQVVAAQELHKIQKVTQSIRDSWKEV